MNCLKNFLLGSLIAVCAAAATPACDPDNGGLTLPPGFCARGQQKSRRGASPTVAPNGDLYVALDGGVAALHDADGDGRFEVTEKFGQGSTTGIELRDGYLWVAKMNSVERYKMTPGQLKPAGAPEVVASGLEGAQEHGDKGIAFDGKGSFYVNVGAPSNACQARDRTKVARAGPMPDPRTARRHLEIQRQQSGADPGGRREVRHRHAADAGHRLARWRALHRDEQPGSARRLWPGKFTAEENATRPAEPMYRVDKQGDNFGWPYCFYDYTVHKLLLNPEYGGDGKMVGRCAEFKLPIASFPAHWAPVDAMFYTGTQFPAHYRDGMFIAFHGSWNRAPLPQEVSNVTFQAFNGADPSGKFEIFASGFAGKAQIMNPNDALARADGVAQAPDGSLYITESQKARSGASSIAARFEPQINADER